MNSLPFTPSVEPKEFPEVPVSDLGENESFRHILSRRVSSKELLLSPIYTEKTIEKKLIDLFKQGDNQKSSFHCLLALVSFPANEQIQNVADFLGLSMPKKLNLDVLDPFLPTYETESEFLDIAAIFIGYQKMDLAKAWIQKGKESQMSPSILEKIELQISRIQAEKTVSGVLHAIEGCFPKYPKRAVRIVEGVMQNPKIRENPVWQSVQGDIISVVYGKSITRLWGGRVV